MQVTIGEAARHLGISEHTVRRRVSNGQLPGSQVATPQGYTWRVEVNGVEPNPEHIPGPDPSPANGEVDALRELVEALRAQVENQQKQAESEHQQLEAKDSQIRELHILLQQTQAALPAPKEGRRWWRFR